MALERAETGSSEYELFSEYKRTRDKELRNKIIESYTYIAEILSRRFINRGVEYEDIYQVACMGIINAVDRFDPDRGVKFASFATPTVLGEIRKYFRDKGFFIKIPRRLYETFCKAEQIKRSEFNGTEPSISELSRILRIPEEVILEAAKLGGGEFIRSLEQEAFADGTMNFGNILGVEDKSFLMVENKNFIDYALECLSEEERDFIEYRYTRELSQKEIARIMSISQMQASRLEKRILKKMRDLYFRD